MNDYNIFSLREPLNRLNFFLKFFVFKMQPRRRRRRRRQRERHKTIGLLVDVQCSARAFCTFLCRPMQNKKARPMPNKTHVPLHLHFFAFLCKTKTSNAQIHVIMENVNMRRLILLSLSGLELRLYEFSY